MANVLTGDGIRLHYEARGVGALTLLFMHGWAGSGSYFDQVLDYLELAELRAVTMDLRGMVTPITQTTATRTNSWRPMRLRWRTPQEPISSCRLVSV